MTRGPVELGKKEQVLNVFIYFQLRFDSFPFHKVENEETNGTGRDGYVRPLFFVNVSHSSGILTPLC